MEKYINNLETWNETVTEIIQGTHYTKIYLTSSFEIKPSIILQMPLNNTEFIGNNKTLFCSSSFTYNWNGLFKGSNSTIRNIILDDYGKGLVPQSNQSILFNSNSNNLTIKNIKVFGHLLNQSTSGYIPSPQTVIFQNCYFTSYSHTINTSGYVVTTNSPTISFSLCNSIMDNLDTSAGYVLSTTDGTITFNNVYFYNQGELINQSAGFIKSVNKTQINMNNAYMYCITIDSQSGGFISTLQQSRTTITNSYSISQINSTEETTANYGTSSFIGTLLNSSNLIIKYCYKFGNNQSLMFSTGDFVGSAISTNLQTVKIDNSYTTNNTPMKGNTITTFTGSYIGKTLGNNTILINNSFSIPNATSIIPLLSLGATINNQEPVNLLTNDSTYDYFFASGNFERSSTYPLLSNFKDINIWLGYNAPNSTPTLKAESIICFLKGTYILTPNGYMPIESLKIGDEITTAENNITTIKEISYQKSLAIFRNAPIKIKKNAFGFASPFLSLYLSPAHKVYKDNRLIPITNLKNNKTIFKQQLKNDYYEYFNLKLEDENEVLVANGVPCEGLGSNTQLDIVETNKRRKLNIKLEIRDRKWRNLLLKFVENKSKSNKC